MSGGPERGTPLVPTTGQAEPWSSEEAMGLCPGARLRQTFIIDGHDAVDVGREFKHAERHVKCFYLVKFPSTAWLMARAISESVRDVAT